MRITELPAESTVVETRELATDSAYPGLTKKATLTQLKNLISTDQRLKEMAECGSFIKSISSVTRDGDDVLTGIVFKWPDGSDGVFTLTTKNNTWLAVDAFTITHVTSGKIITQPAISRDSNGNISVKPAMTVT
jgi:hypothetical protein